VPYLILSDIHGNQEALDAVVEDAQGLYDRVLCLGDLVGYGADPNYVAEWARKNAAVVIRGNHDRVCSSTDPVEVYNPSARASAIWTRTVLKPENVTYLENLARGPLRVASESGIGFDLVHGSPADEDEYLIHPGDVEPLRAWLDTQLTFFGHTHVQGGFLLARGGTRRILPSTEPVLQLGPDHYYLVNPGSVGQPRDMNPRAAYAIYTPDAHTVEFRRVRYNHARAAEKILEAGLPPSLGMRLHEGT
jgi:predicted phosphodiesterase